MLKMIGSLAVLLCAISMPIAGVFVLFYQIHSMPHVFLGVLLIGLGLIIFLLDSIDGHAEKTAEYSRVTFEAIKQVRKIK